MKKIYWGMLLGITLWESEGNRNGSRGKMGSDVITTGLQPVPQELWMAECGEGARSLSPHSRRVTAASPGWSITFN